MDSTGVIFLILAIVFMLCLMYLCCWWYCTHGRCCASPNQKKSRKGPAYIRADSFKPEKEVPYTPSNNNNNNSAPGGILYKTSINEVDSGKVKYPSAPAVEDSPTKSSGIRQPSISLMDAKYAFKNSSRPSTSELKLQNAAPPSPPPTEKKIGAGTAATFMYNNPTTVTTTRERNYQPLVGSSTGYERKLSSYGMDSRPPLINYTTTSTFAERKPSLLSERSEPSWLSEKRSVSPRPASPFEAASSRMSTTSNSEFSRYTNIRSSSQTPLNQTVTTVKKIQLAGSESPNDDEQTLTIKIRADEADKVSSILSDAVRSGELSSAEAISQEKTVDVKRMLEKYETGKAGGESTVVESSSNSFIVSPESRSELKSVGLVSAERISSIIPAITTTSSSAVEGEMKDMVEQVMSSIEETAPGYVIQKTVTTSSSKEAGQIVETTMTSRKSSSSFKENESSS